METAVALIAYLACMSAATPLILVLAIRACSRTALHRRCCELEHENFVLRVAMSSREKAVAGRLKFDAIMN